MSAFEATHGKTPLAWIRERESEVVQIEAQPGLAGTPGFRQGGYSLRGVPRVKDGAVYAFTANGVRSVTLSDDPHTLLYAPSGDPEDLGEIRAKVIHEHYRNGCKIRVWEQVPGGKFCLFETYGLPEDIKRCKA